ncbi:MAG: hypothetical protein ACFFBD_16385 [Candidatus Hodarchaeota archaeon]
MMEKLAWLNTSKRQKDDLNPPSRKLRFFMFNFGLPVFFLGIVFLLRSIEVIILILRYTFMIPEYDLLAMFPVELHAPLTLTLD